MRTLRRGASLFGYGLFVGFLAVTSITVLRVSGIEVERILSTVAESLGDLSGDGSGSGGGPIGDNGNEPPPLNSPVTGALVLLPAGARAGVDTVVADTSGIVDPDGLGPFSWFWERSSDGENGWTSVASATGDEFPTVSGDACSYLRAEISFTDGAGHPERVSSNVLRLLSDTGNMTEIWRDTLADGPRGLHLAGDRLYVADRVGRALVIYDVAESAAIETLGRLTFPVAGGPNLVPRSVAVLGNHAYLATNLGIQVVDVADPGAPVAAGGPVGVGGEVGDVDIEGGRLFTAGQAGVAVFDLADPASPVLLSSDAGGGNTAIDAAAGMVFTAHWEHNEVAWYDVDAGGFLGNRRVLTLSNAHEVRYHDGSLFVASFEGAVSRLDISSGSFGAVLQTYGGGAGVTGLWVDGGLIYATAMLDGTIGAWDIANGGLPMRMVPIGGFAADVVARGGTVYGVAESAGGVAVFDDSGCP